MQTALNCHIDIIPSNRKSKLKKSLRFEFHVPEPKVKDTFMINFNDLNLNSSEKKELSQQHRKKILNFKNLNTQLIKQYSKELISYLEELKGSEVKIKANDIGTYICLTAVYSGELTNHSNWKFELSESPLALFPKELVNRHLNDNIDISFTLGNDCWLKPFRSLYTPPTFLSLPNKKKLLIVA